MFSHEFPEICWNKIVSFVGRSNLYELRRLNRESRKQIDERTRTYRQLKQIISDETKPRLLLRTVYIPKGFRRNVPSPKHVIEQRPIFPQPSSTTISVMTLVAYLSTPLDLRSVFHCVDVVDFKNRMNLKKL